MFEFAQEDVESQEFVIDNNSPNFIDYFLNSQMDVLDSNFNYNNEIMNELSLIIDLLIKIS